MDQHPREQMVRVMTDEIERYEREQQQARLQHAIDQGLLPAGTRPEDLSPDDRACYLGE